MKRISKILGVIVLFLGIFTFTSKINSNNNIEKYVVKLNPSSYSQPSDPSDENRVNIIGYFNSLDLESENNLIAVYESPKSESALFEENDYVGRFFISLIRNIDKINNYSEIITLILGIYIFVLNKFHNGYKQWNNFQSVE